MGGMNLPGSGAITPSLLQTTSSIHSSSQPVSPQALSDALPAIAEQLSAWAGAGGAECRMQQGGNSVGSTGNVFGLGMDPGPPANAWMQTEDDRQTFSSEGGESAGLQSATSAVLMEAATLESLRLDAMHGYGNGMDSGMQMDGNNFQNYQNMAGFTHESPSSISAPSTSVSDKERLRRLPQVGLFDLDR
jgi:hypothetical protein